MLLRTISNINAWRQKTLNKIGCPNSVASGNAMSELKTSGNEHALSVWVTPTDNIADIKDIIVANAVTRNCLQGISYAILDESAVKNQMDIDVKNVIGISKPILDTAILQRHRDLSNLDFWKLGYLAECISRFVQGTVTNSISKQDVQTYIQEYIDLGKVDYNELQEGLRVNFTPKQ